MITFKVAVRADRQVREAADWWEANRSDAPTMFEEDLESAFALIEAFPHAGESVSHPRMSKLRRVLLSRVQYHMYYNAHIDDSVIEVLALWHTSRGTKPPL